MHTVAKKNFSSGVIQHVVTILWAGPLKISDLLPEDPFFGDTLIAFPHLELGAFQDRRPGCAESLVGTPVARPENLFFHGQSLSG
jgi:hypothetical protein